MKSGKIILLSLCLSAIVAGCKKSDEYSDVPAITFKSLTIQKSPGSAFDSVATLVISFTDGDGDIGTRSYDGVPNNFIVTEYDKKNGVWVLDSTDLSGHLPYLTPTGNNKALRGDIETAVGLPFSVTNDTIRFEVFIYDRAMHKSNTITTPERIITTN